METLGAHDHKDPETPERIIALVAQLANVQLVEETAIGRKTKYKKLKGGEL